MIIIKILVSLLFCLFSMRPIFKAIKRGSFSFSNNKIDLLYSLVVFIGCFIVFYSFDFSLGLNSDEASVGYEAFSLINNGVDRNGVSWPLYMIAWGSGQSAFYTYLVIPFVYLFGLCRSSVVLPMSIISSITIVVLSNFFRNVFKEKGLIGLVLFIMMPWFYLKSKVGLDCNVFPDLVLWGIISLYYGIENKKKYLVILSSIIFGISTFSYISSALFIPLFLMIMYFVLWKKKYFSLKDVIINFLITGVVAMPMILLVIINFFDLESIKFLGFTIPKMYSDRVSVATGLSGNILVNFFNNIISMLRLILLQADSVKINSIYPFGVLYYFSLPFIIYGIFKSFKIKKLFNYLLNSLFIACCVLCIVVVPNISRVNILWYCLILYEFFGIISIKNIRVVKSVILIYFINFLCLNYVYFNNYVNSISNYMKVGLEDAFDYALKLDYDELYFGDNYIYYLFYSEYDSKEFVKKRKASNFDEQFYRVSRIDNVFFELDEINENNVYIVSNEELKLFDLSSFNIKKFDNYFVVYK